MVIFSLIFLAFLSHRKFGTLRNPVFYFLVIHYFHNFSFSTLKNKGLDIYWRASRSVDYSTMGDIITFNLIAMWLTSLVLLFFIRRKDNYIIIKSDLGPKKICHYVYIFFTFFLLLSQRDLILGQVIYGSGQSIDVFGSFDPFQRIWNLRIYFLAYAVVFCNVSNRNLLIYLAIETLVAFLLTERKELAFVVCCVIICNFDKIRFRVLRIKFRQVVVYLGLFCVGIMIPVYRSFGPGGGFFNKLSMTLDSLKESSGQYLYYATGFVNSEGVQNWTIH